MRGLVFAPRPAVFALFLLVYTVGIAPASEPAGKPNVVIILADDARSRTSTT